MKILVEKSSAESGNFKYSKRMVVEILEKFAEAPNYLHISEYSSVSS